MYAKKAYIELSNKNLFENFYGSVQASKFSNIGGTSLTGVWKDGAGQPIIVDGSKIKSYYSQTNLPINFLTPTLFSVEFQDNNGKLDGTLNSDGTSISWRKAGQNMGTWKKISDSYGKTNNLPGIWQDGAGERIVIKDASKIDNYYDQTNIPITQLTPNDFTAQFSESSFGTLEGNINDNGDTINWVKNGNFIGSWQKTANWETPVSDTGAGSGGGSTLVSPKPPKPPKQLNDNGLDVQMPSGTNTPGQTPDIETPSTKVGMDTLTKGLIITGIIVGVLAIWKGSEVIKYFKGSTN